MLGKEMIAYGNIYKRSDQSRTAYAGSAATQYARGKEEAVCAVVVSGDKENYQLPRSMPTQECLILGESMTKKLQYFPWKIFLKISIPSGRDNSDSSFQAIKFLRDSRLSC